MNPVSIPNPVLTPMIASAIKGERPSIHNWNERIKQDVLNELSAIQRREEARVAASAAIAPPFKFPIVHIPIVHKPLMSETQTVAKPSRRPMQRVKYRICKSIPVPEDLQDSGLKYPFAEMTRGSSFLVPKVQPAKGALRSATIYGRKHGQKFVHAVQADGTRIWRVK